MNRRDFRFMAGALLLGLVLLLPAAAGAETKTGCRTAQRVAAFAALLKTRPGKGAVEDFIRKNKITTEQPYPRKNPALLIASVSDSDCDPLDYQHDRHVFYIRIHRNIAIGFSETLASGGP